MSVAINDTLIRDVVSEVLSRLQTGGGSNGSALAAPARAAEGVDGIFQTVDGAVAAAKAAQQRLAAATLETRGEVIQCIRDIVIQQAEELGKIEFEETKIGRLDHKIEKLVVVTTTRVRPAASGGKTKVSKSSPGPVPSKTPSRRNVTANGSPSGLWHSNVTSLGSAKTTLYSARSTE